MSGTRRRLAAWLRAALLAGLGAVAGCSGLNLGDNPGREVPKQVGPLTRPPDHLRTSTDPR